MRTFDRLHYFPMKIMVLVNSLNYAEITFYITLPNIHLKIMQIIFLKKGYSFKNYTNNFFKKGAQVDVGSKYKS